MRTHTLSAVYGVIALKFTPYCDSCRLICDTRITNRSKNSQ